MSKIKRVQEKAIGIYLNMVGASPYKIYWDIYSIHKYIYIHTHTEYIYLYIYMHVHIFMKFISMPISQRQYTVYFSPSFGGLLICQCHCIVSKITYCYTQHSHPSSEKFCGSSTMFFSDFPRRLLECDGVEIFAFLDKYMLSITRGIELKFFNR